MSIDRCKCPVCAALPSNPTLIAPPQTIFDLVKSDLDERDRIGAERHGGRPLGNYCAKCGHDKAWHPPNFAPYPNECQCMEFTSAKSWLREAYEEALDLCVYLRGALAEWEAKK